MTNIYVYIFAMAVTTYLIRMLPFTLFKKKIENERVLSFLHYVPYACLTTMTIPAIFSSTSSVISASVGFIVAVLLALKNISMPIVAFFACIAVFICERIIL